MICQIHANELTICHLFEYYDGKTTGPRSYSGPLNKALIGGEKMRIVKFEALEFQLPDMTKITNLSKD